MPSPRKKWCRPGWDAVVAVGAAVHISFLLVALGSVIWSPTTFVGITSVPLDRVVDCQGIVSNRTGLPKERDVAEQAALLQIASALVVLSMVAMATSTMTLPGAVRTACSRSRVEAPWVASLRWALAMPAVCISVCLFTLLMRTDATYGDYDSIDPSLAPPVCRTSYGFPVLVVNVGTFSQVCSLMLLVPRRLAGERREITPWAIAAFATNLTGVGSVALMLPVYTPFVFDMRLATYGIMLATMAGAGIYLFLTTSWISSKVAIPVVCVACEETLRQEIAICCCCCSCCRRCQCCGGTSLSSLSSPQLPRSMSGSWVQRNRPRRRSAKIMTAAQALNQTASRASMIRKASMPTTRSFVEMLPPPLEAGEVSAACAASSTADRSATIAHGGRPAGGGWRILSMVRPDTLGALPRRMVPKSSEEDDRRRSAQLGGDRTSACGVECVRLSVRVPPSNVAILAFIMLIDSGYLLSVSLLDTGFGQHAINLACIITFVSVPLSLAVVSGAHRRAVVAATEASLREQARSLHRMIAFVSNEARNPVSAAMLGADMAKASVDQLILRVRHHADELKVVGAPDADGTHVSNTLESVHDGDSIVTSPNGGSSAYQASTASPSPSSEEILRGLHRALDSLHTVTTGLSTARAVLSDSLGLQRALEAQSDTLKPSWMTLGELVDPLRIMYSGVRPKPEAPSKAGEPSKVLVAFIVDGGLVLDDGLGGRTAPQLYCDASAVSQVITNFVSNALKHAHSRVGVRVILALPAALDHVGSWSSGSRESTIDVESPGLPAGGIAEAGDEHGEVWTPADDRHGLLPLAAGGDGMSDAMVVAVIGDNGAGVDPVVAKSLFVSFRELAERGAARSTLSSGLGLSLCQDVATLLGGAVRYRNRADGTRGSEFVLAVPVKVRAAQPHLVAESGTCSSRVEALSFSVGAGSQVQQGRTSEVGVHAVSRTPGAGCQPEMTRSAPVPEPSVSERVPGAAAGGIDSKYNS